MHVRVRTHVIFDHVRALARIGSLGIVCSRLITLSRRRKPFIICRYDSSFKNKKTNTAHTQTHTTSRDMATAGETNPSDPKGWVQNPPSTIVKVVGTSREDVNGSLGIVVSYNNARGRYMVHLTQSQNQVAMKPDNLVPASMLEKGKAYYEQARNEPQIRTMINNVTARLPPGVTLQQVGLGIVVVLVGLIYFLGFSRTLMLISFTMIVLMVIGPDLMAGNANAQTIVRNAPDRFRAMVRDSFPGGRYIADKPYALAALAALMVVFFVKSMVTSPSAYKTAASTGNIPFTADHDPTTTTMPSRPGVSLTPREYYNLGFEDAKQDRIFGESLPKEDDPIYSSSSSSSYDPMDNDAQYTMPPPPSSDSWGSKLFSMSSAMSLMYIGRTVMELGRGGPQGQWNFELFKANLANMETWKLGLLGLSLYRLVAVFIK